MINENTDQTGRLYEGSQIYQAIYNQYNNLFTITRNNMAWDSHKFQLLNIEHRDKD